MTGGHVQGDLLAPEDVVSLLLDDAQLEQKLKEVSQQVSNQLVCRSHTECFVTKITLRYGQFLKKVTTKFVDYRNRPLHNILFYNLHMLRRYL